MIEEISTETRYIDSGIAVKVLTPDADKLDLLARAEKMCFCRRDSSRRIVESCTPHQMLRDFGTRLLFEHHNARKLELEEFSIQSEI